MEWPGVAMAKRNRSRWETRCETVLDLKESLQGQKKSKESLLTVSYPSILGCLDQGVSGSICCLASESRHHFVTHSYAF